MQVKQVQAQQEEEQQVQLQHSDYEHQDGGSAAVSSTRRAVSMPTSLSSSTLASDDEAVPGEPQGSSPLKDSHHGRASAGPLSTKSLSTSAVAVGDEAAAAAAAAASNSGGGGGGARRTNLYEKVCVYSCVCLCVCVLVRACIPCVCA